MILVKSLSAVPVLDNFKISFERARRPTLASLLNAANAAKLGTSTMSKTSTLLILAILALNVVLAIFVILVQKYLLSSLDFKFPVAMTMSNYIITWSCTELCRVLGIYHQKPWKEMPLNRDMLSLIVVVALAVPINNLSLQFNGVGTYQLLKLLITPTICWFEYYWNGTTLSCRRGLALIVASFGVALFTVKDLEIKFIGLFWAGLFLPISAHYKIHWKAVQKSFGPRYNALSLIHRVYPLCLPIMVPLSFFIDPPGIVSYQWNSSVILLIVVSGIVIFGICISSLYIIVAFSPLTHQVLGLFKVCISLLLGVFVFGNDMPSGGQAFGLCLALVSVIVYTVITTADQAKQKQEQKKDLILLQVV